VHVGCPEWFFPILGAAFACVAEGSRAGSHPLLKLPCEAVERIACTPSAVRPWKVSEKLAQASPAGLVGLAAEATTLPALRINSRPAVRSSIRNKM